MANNSSLDEYQMLEEYRMHRAAEKGDFKKVKHLLRRGYPKDIPDTTNGFTPLLYAAIHGHFQVVKLLVRHNCDVNYNCRGYTPMLVSAACERKDIVNFLMWHGATSAGGADSQRAAVIHYATFLGWLDIVKRLVEREGKAALEAKAEREMTPLMWTASYGRSAEVAEYLIKAGADFNHRDCYGITSLHFAALKNQIGVARVLLATPGLDLDAADCDGETPLHVAVRMARLEIVEMMLDAGADTELKNGEGETAFSIGIRDKTLGPKEVKLFFQRGLYFHMRDVARILESEETMEQFLANVDLCTLSIINRFHNKLLTELYNNPELAAKLPTKEKFKLNTQEMQDIENFVRFDLEGNYFVDVLDPHPIVLKLMCVRALLRPAPKLTFAKIVTAYNLGVFCYLFGKLFARVRLR